ncbi:membrane-spanning 4-domains subfamily A member 4A [Centroberyx gerrardi]
MSSASITTSGGVVVVTQVFPQDQNGKISLPPAASTGPAPPAGPAPAKPSDMTASFLRGEPQSLGIVQIFIGLVCVLLSLAAILPAQLLHAPLFIGVAFVLSGSLAVAARRGTTVGLIRATLASGLLSALLALMGVAYLCWLLADRSASYQLCGVWSDYRYADYDSSKRKCLQMARQLSRVLDGLHGLVLVLLVLEVCVAVTLCVFSGKALSRRGRSVPHTVVMVSDHAACGSNVALLDSEEKVSVPPPYSP